MSSEGREGRVLSRKRHAEGLPGGWQCSLGLTYYTAHIYFYTFSHNVCSISQQKTKKIWIWKRTKVKLKQTWKKCSYWNENSVNLFLLFPSWTIPSKSLTLCVGDKLEWEATGSRSWVRREPRYTRHLTAPGPWYMLHMCHLLLSLQRNSWEMEYLPPLYLVSHPLSLTSDSSCLWDFTHFVLTTSCFKCTIHATHFLSWCFAVRCQWKPMWNVHIHSLEVGEASPSGTTLSQLGVEANGEVLKDSLERHFLIAPKVPSGIKPHLPIEGPNSTVYPGTGSSFSPLHLFPQVTSQINYLHWRPYVRLCFQG